MDTFVIQRDANKLPGILQFSRMKKALNQISALVLVRVHVQMSNAKYSRQECFLIAT